MNSEDKKNNKMDGKHLEFMMDLSDIKPYIDADMYHQISKAFWNKDGEGINNAIMSLCKLISMLRAEIKRIEEDREELRKEMEKCLCEKEKQRQELIAIHTSQFGKYFVAKHLYEDGYSLSEVARYLGVNRETVRKYLASLGVEIRENKGGRPKSPVKGGKI